MGDGVARVRRTYHLILGSPYTWPLGGKRIILLIFAVNDRLTRVICVYVLRLIPPALVRRLEGKGKNCYRKLHIIGWPGLHGSEFYSKLMQQVSTEAFSLLDQDVLLLATCHDASNNNQEEKSKLSLPSDWQKVPLAKFGTVASASVPNSASAARLPNLLFSIFSFSNSIIPLTKQNLEKLSKILRKVLLMLITLQPRLMWKRPRYRMAKDIITKGRWFCWTCSKNFHF